MGVDAAILKAINKRLKAENALLRAENQQLRAAQAKLTLRLDALERALGHAPPPATTESPPTPAEPTASTQLQAALTKAEKRIAELERVNARQAAPFRRRQRVTERKRPGRQPGHRGAQRPRPTQIDHDIDVPLEHCPECQCPLNERRPITQYIEELPPVRPVVTRLTTWQATCPCCGKSVQSTHPQQVSAAQGAAGVHLGPRATALATALKSRFGLTMRNICAILRQAFGLSLTPGGLAQLLQRVAQKARPQHAELRQQIRTSPAVYADETSWYTHGCGNWLWVFTTPQHTLYHVNESRGGPVARSILGEEFAGVLVTDCAAMYSSLPCPQHKCIAHHLRRLHEAREYTNDPAYLDQWQAFWQQVIDLTKQRSTLTPTAFADQRAVLQQRLKILLSWDVSQLGDRQFRTRMINAEQHLLGCLEYDVEPTNNRAERAIRPAVIARKLSCGNKTARGAETWEILASLSTTLQQQGADLLDYFTKITRLQPTLAR